MWGKRMTIPKLSDAIRVFNDITGSDIDEHTELSDISRDTVRDIAFTYTRTTGKLMHEDIRYMSSMSLDDTERCLNFYKMYGKDSDRLDREIDGEIR